MFIFLIIYALSIINILQSLSLFVSTYGLYFDLFGITLFILTIVTALLCLYFANNKLFKQTNTLYYIFLFILFILFFFFTTTNFILFFIFYELLLIPSIYLALLSSPNIRSKHISYYFLFWTQLGSFFVFIAVCLLYVITNTQYFNNLQYFYINNLITILLFFGFGIKIPIWPFHFWLTKTHVEVNTSFSIFLSGILVKTALYGLYKFNFLFYELSYVFFIFYFLGILDVTVKLFSQIDVKKIVANCTVFEMNIIMINFLYLNTSSYLFLIYFSCLHTMLSFLFFFSVECIYKRYNTRSIYGITNILNNYPILAIFIVINVLLFNGLPLTLKFNLEIILILKLLNHNFIYLFIFLLIQIIFIIFFTKNFFSIIFLNSSNNVTCDLQFYEILIYFSIYSFFIILSLN